MQALLLGNLELSLRRELSYQNSLFVKGNQMQEVKSLAAGMKEAIANVRKLSTDAKAGLDSEVNRALTNADKVRSFTRELSDANKEVEAFLGDTGSNFSQEDGSTQQQVGHKPDVNGVTLNTGG